MHHTAFNAFGEPTSINGALSHLRKILWQVPPESPEWSEAAHRMMAILSNPEQAEELFSEAAKNGRVAVMQRTSSEEERELLRISRETYLRTIKSDLGAGVIPSLENLLLAFPHHIDTRSAEAGEVHAAIVSMLEAAGPHGQRRAVQFGLLLDLRHMDSCHDELAAYGDSLPPDTPAARQLQARLSATSVIRNLFAAKLRHTLSSDPSSGGRIDLKQANRATSLREKLLTRLKALWQRNGN